MIHNHLSCKYKVFLDIIFTLSDFLNVDSWLLQHDMANLQKKKDEEKVSSFFQAKSVSPALERATTLGGWVF